MDGTGARGRQADAWLARELGVRTSHERGHLFVAHLNEARLVAELLDAAHDPVDTVAGIAEDALDAPFAQAPH